MSTKTNLNECLKMVAFIVAVLCMNYPVSAVSWKVTQVTDNNYNDRSSKISGSNVVWEHYDGNDNEIFFWDGTTITQVTDNSYGDYNPQISGSNVVWENSLGGPIQYNEIFFWNTSMGEPCQVTDNSYHDYGPQISGSNVVWQGTDGSDIEIFFWDGTTITQVTDNSYDDDDPQISGSNVVWRGHDGNDYEIFFWNASMGEPYQVTENGYYDHKARVSGSNVVWKTYDGDDYEIFFWNTSMGEPCQVTDNGYHDYEAQISGTNVVWYGRVGVTASDYEIFFWDASIMGEPYQVTDNSDIDYDPQISGANVVWYGYEGVSDTEIFFWNTSMGEPYQVTENGYNDWDPQISGSNVVWTAWDGNDEEIFMAILLPTIYVDADATGGANNGTSWENAYLYLQDALDDPCLASGGEILVASGTYKPDANSSNPSGSGARAATFQLINGVIIKGGYAGVGADDPNERDVKKYETVLSGDIGTPNNISNNSYHVVTGSGTEPNAVLDGFTITAGNANGASPYNGGGGMYNEGGSPTVIKCTFINNSASSTGGGMENRQDNPVVTNCTFSGNSTNYGGGMYNYESSPMVRNCKFSGNSAGIYGGGMRNYQSSPTVTNCTFSSNTAVDYGGGIANSGSSNPVVTNCTFSGNSANYGGGMRNWQNSIPTLTNCILWGNTVNEIYGERTVNYSNVQGGTSGTGNINADPCFVDAVGGDFRLSVTSPCIDAGDNSAPNLPDVDMDGHSRIIDGDCDESAVVDMGAYEFNYAYIGDLDYNCSVDFFDFSIFGRAWMTEEGDPDWDWACDISDPPDDYIDWRDVAILCDNWLATP